MLKKAFVDGYKMDLEKESLEVLDRRPMYQRPVSSVLGRLSSPLTAIVMGATTPLKPGSSLESEDIQDILETAEDDPQLQDLLISLGGGRPWTALKRTWQNKRTSIPSKLFGTVMWPVTQVQSAISRGDHYDPQANMVVSYTDDPAILSHEIGHAQDYSAQKYPGLYHFGRLAPWVALNQEYKASRLALKRLMKKALKDGKVTDDEMKSVNRASRVLGGGLGSYIGNYVGAPLDPILGSGISLASGLVGQGVGAASGAFTTSEEKAKLLAAMKDASKGKNKDKDKKAKPEE